MLVQELIRSPYKLVFFETESNILTEDEFNNILDILKYFKSANKLDYLYIHYDNYNLINITHLIESYDFLTISMSNADHNQLIVYLSNLEAVRPIYRKLDIVTEAEGGSNIWLLPLTIKTNELLYYNEVDFEVIANNNIKPAVFMLNSKILQTVTETDASSLQSIYSSPFYTQTGYIDSSNQFIQVVKRADDGIPIPDDKISVYSSDLFRYLIIYSTEPQAITLDYNLAITAPEVIDNLPYKYDLIKGINLIDFGNTIATKWKTPLDQRLSTDLYYFEPYEDAESATYEIISTIDFDNFEGFNTKDLQNTYSGFVFIYLNKNDKFSINERVTPVNILSGQYYSRTRRAELNSFDLSEYNGSDPYINFTNVANTFLSGYSIRMTNDISQYSNYFVIPIGRINRHLCEGWKYFDVNKGLGTYFFASNNNELIPYVYVAATNFKDKWLNPTTVQSDYELSLYNASYDPYNFITIDAQYGYYDEFDVKQEFQTSTATFRLSGNTSLSSSWQSTGFYGINSFAPWDIPNFYTFKDAPPNFNEADLNKLKEYRYEYVGPQNFTYESDALIYLGDLNWNNLSSFSTVNRSRSCYPSPAIEQDYGFINLVLYQTAQTTIINLGASYLADENNPTIMKFRLEQVIYDSCFNEFYYSSTDELTSDISIFNQTVYTQFKNFQRGIPTQNRDIPRSSYLHQIGLGLRIYNFVSGVKFEATWVDNTFQVRPITILSYADIFQDLIGYGISIASNYKPIFRNYQLTPQVNRGLIPADVYAGLGFSSWNGTIDGVSCRLLFPNDDPVQLPRVAFGTDTLERTKYYIDLSDQNHQYSTTFENGMRWNAITHLMDFYVIPIDMYIISNGRPNIDYEVFGPYNLNQVFELSNLGQRGIKMVPVVRFKCNGTLSLFNASVPDSEFARRLYARLRVYINYADLATMNEGLGFSAPAAILGTKNDFPVISHDKFRSTDASIPFTINLWNDDNFQWYTTTLSSNSPVKCGAGYSFKNHDTILVSREELNEGKPVYTYLDPGLQQLQTLEVIDVLSRAVDYSGNVFTVNHQAFGQVLLYPGTDAIRHFALITPHSFPSGTFFIDRLVQWHLRLQELSDNNGLRGYLYHTTDPTANKPSIMITQPDKQTVSAVFAAKEFICGNSFINDTDGNDRLNNSHWIMKPIITKPLSFSNYDLKKYDWSLSNQTWNHLYQENLSQVGIYSAYGLRRTTLNEKDFVGFGADNLREAITLPSNIPGFNLAYHYEIFYFSERVILFDQIQWTSRPFNGITQDAYSSDSFILPDWLTNGRSFYLDIVYKDRKTAPTQLYTDAYLINGIYPLSYINNSHQTEYFINNKLQFLSRFFIVTKEDLNNIRILLALA